MMRIVHASVRFLKQVYKKNPTVSAPIISVAKGVFFRKNEAARIALYKKRRLPKGRVKKMFIDVSGQELILTIYYTRCNVAIFALH